MAYEPKTWACGDTITADDLNHIENGIAEIGCGVEIVNITATGTLPNISGTSDKTHAELLSAHNSGKVIIANVEIPQGGGPALSATPLAFTDYMGGVFSGNVVLHNGSNAWMVGVSYSSYSLYLNATKISVTE